MLDKKFFKIICFIALLLTSVISLSSCANNNQLLLLNWGEYINEDLVREACDGCPVEAISIEE